MLRLTTVLLVLATSAIAVAADGLWEFTDLRTELSQAETLPEQRDVIERMRAAVQSGVRPGRQISTMIYFLSKQPVLNEAATISFLRELVATPGTADAATDGIAGLIGSDSLSEQAAEILAEELRSYHREQGLSQQAILKLQFALTRETPQANREYALDILMIRPPEGDGRSRFLGAVARLLGPEMSVGEKRAAMQILGEAAQSGPLPRHARTAIYRAATEEPDASIRVSAWPFVMREKFDRRGTDRGSHYFLGAGLNDQLVAAEAGSTPSFVNADEASREQAVRLLNDYWHPEYHSEYIDILIQLVDRHGSPASMAKLLELRRDNALNDDQLAALAAVAADNPTIEPSLEQSLETITIPNLAEGSLVGPVEAIGSSNDPEEWARATQQLLAQYPDGAVPVSVAEAAYTVIARSGDYDAAAAALFVRGDMPFAEREAKILELVDRTPRHSGQIVMLLQHLHGDVDKAFLVRRYANDQSIEEAFRGTLLSALYREVRETGQMDAETTEAVVDYGRSADGYFSISTAGRLLEASGRDVPWSIRIRQERFHWDVLGWIGLLALAVGAIGGLYLLVLVAVPGRASGLSGVQRLSGFALWLMLCAAYFGAALQAVLHSIGHGSTPPPDRAFPFYAATLVIAVLFLVVAITLHRLRSPDGNTGAAAATA